MTVRSPRAGTLPLLAAVGGWRTVAESIASRATFLVAFLLSGSVGLAVGIALGVVAVFGAVRVVAAGGAWQVLVSVGTVGVSAVLAAHAGRAEDFYLPVVIAQPLTAIALLVSMLVGRPLVGVALEAAQARAAGGRPVGARHRRDQWCTAVFVTKFGLATAVLWPLYLSGRVLPLGLAAVLLGGAPALAICVLACRRILGTPDPVGWGPRC